MPITRELDVIGAVTVSFKLTDELHETFVADIKPTFSHQFIGAYVFSHQVIGVYVRQPASVTFMGPTYASEEDVLDRIKQEVLACESSKALIDAITQKEWKLYWPGQSKFPEDTHEEKDKKEIFDSAHTNHSGQLVLEREDGLLAVLSIETTMAMCRTIFNGPLSATLSLTLKVEWTFTKSVPSEKQTMATAQSVLAAVTAALCDRHKEVYEFLMRNAATAVVTSNYDTPAYVWTFGDNDHKGN